MLVDRAGAGGGPRLTSLALVLGSSWAGRASWRGYGSVTELDADEAGGRPRY